MGLEPTNLLTASQALYQLSYTPRGRITLSGVDRPLIFWRVAPQLSGLRSELAGYLIATAWHRDPTPPRAGDTAA